MGAHGRPGHPGEPAAGPGPGRRKAGGPVRILVKAVNWLGDLVMTMPALRALRRAYPRAHLAVLVRGELAGFYAGCRWLDAVVPYAVRPGLSGLADRARIVRRIRAGRYDLAVVLPRSFESALWVFLARVPRRVGVRSDGRGWLLTERVPMPRRTPRHQSEDYLALLTAALGVHGAADPPPLLEVDPARRERMTAWLAARRRGRGPLVALAVGAAYGPAKEWPAERFAELIRRLATRHAAQCVLVGAPGERERCRRVADASGAEPLVAAGETDVGDLVALLSLCDGFAGNDSGAMHVAAALGVPTVGIFGSTDPDRTGPRGPATAVVREPVPCSPCLARTCRFGHYDCLRRISVDAVEARLEALGALGRREETATRVPDRGPE